VPGFKLICQVFKKTHPARLKFFEILGKNMVYETLKRKDFWNFLKTFDFLGKFFLKILSGKNFFFEKNENQRGKSLFIIFMLYLR